MITFVPMGGLANRMRAMAAAVSLSQKSGQQTIIRWFKEKGINCRFGDLFCDVSLSDIRLKENIFFDRFLFDYPRKTNFYLSKYFQKCWYSRSLYGENTRTTDFDYLSWAMSNKRSYIVSYSPFVDINDDLWKKLFVPVAELQKEIDAQSKLFTSRTVGIHIRRSDNIESIRKSPIELFINMIEKELLICPDCLFFVCSDSEESKQLLKNKFGNHIILSAKRANRNDLLGMRGAVVDMFALSKCNKIIGSYYSSFSEVAALLGGVSLTIAKKEE